MFGLGIQEILVIAFIILLLFGGKKIPEMMRGLGRGVKSFKEGMKEDTEKESSAQSNESSEKQGSHGEAAGKVDEAAQQHNGTLQQ